MEGRAIKTENIGVEKIQITIIQDLWHDYKGIGE
jgi:hypothetical protein